ncbi:MAG: FAD:protein FMN transferase, partial [Ignavibacteriaceae bacterium]|nr:FAD:protein FMN transferase [Ignavibacteriaceae bacterium]
MIKRIFKRISSLRGGVWGWVVAFIVLFLIGFYIARNTGEELKTVKRTQILLGTVVDIQVRDTDEQAAEEAINLAFTEVKRIDNLFSTYSKESPVWMINHSADSLIIVDEEIYKLLVLCDSITKLSDGSFDVSLDNLIMAWGFYTNNPRMPSALAVDSALMNSGWEKVRLLGNNGVIRSHNAGLNFGAIAKGYAVDKAIDVLKNSGIKSVLVNAGGEIKSLGTDWIVGVQHPREVNEIIRRIKLNRMSVATSGDYENYFEKNGVRYHHILDPKTGYPSKGLQ